MCQIFLTWCCFWMEWSFFLSHSGSHSAVLFTLKTAVHPPCSPVSIVITFRWAHIFHWCSSVCMFCSKTWRFLHVSFMWTAWASGMDGNWFPLWSNTTFKLTLEESMKSLHCPQVCSRCNFPLLLGCYFSSLDHHPLCNMLLCLPLPI
jgi:hypothetical protein